MKNRTYHEAFKAQQQGSPSYNEAKERIEKAIPPSSPLRDEPANIELLVVGVLAGDVKIVTLANGEVRITPVADIWP